MVPSSTHQPQVLAKLLSHFNWTWVGLVGSDGDNLEWLEQQLRKVRRAGGCVAFSRIGSQAHGIHSVASVLAASPTTAVIVCDCYHLHFRLLAEALWEKNVTWGTWVFSTSFPLQPIAPC